MADTEYALLVLPVYVGLAVRTWLSSALRPPRVRGRVLRESGLPSLPLELLNGIIAGRHGVSLGTRRTIAAAALLAVLVVLIPLTRASWTG